MGRIGGDRGGHESLAGESSHFEQGVRGQPQFRGHPRRVDAGLRRRRQGGGRQGSYRPRNGTPARLRLRRVRGRGDCAEVHRAVERQAAQGSSAARQRGREPAAASCWRGGRSLVPPIVPGGASRRLLRSASSRSSARRSPAAAAAALRRTRDHGRASSRRGAWKNAATAAPTTRIIRRFGASLRAHG